jgi:DNA-binding LacI/PurR family transcriptional regulator
MQELGETAAHLLLRRLREPRVHVPGVLLPHQLILRRSA